MSRKDKILVRNAIYCTRCHTEIESKHEKDLQHCKCNQNPLGIDGGLVRPRMVYKYDKYYEDRRIWCDPEDYGTMQRYLPWTTPDGSTVTLVSLPSDQLKSILASHAQVLSPAYKECIKSILKDRYQQFIDQFPEGSSMRSLFDDT